MYECVQAGRELREAIGEGIRGVQDNVGWGGQDCQLEIGWYVRAVFVGDSTRYTYSIV